jgi:hypothetical protein
MHWIELKSFPKYEINPLGFIRKKSNKRILKNEINPSGYCVVSLYYNTKNRKRKLVSRLIAETFLVKPEGKDFVNHIDGIKTHNEVTNLEWVNHSENILHALRTGLLKPCQCDHFKTAVNQYDLSGNLINSYDSITEAEKATGARNSNISKVCAGERKSSGGFIWKYKTENNYAIQ